MGGLQTLGYRLCSLQCSLISLEPKKSQNQTLNLVWTKSLKNCGDKLQLREGNLPNMKQSTDNVEKSLQLQVKNLCQNNQSPTNEQLLAEEVSWKNK